MKLTQLHKECLQNMPMLIDSIYDTIKNLGEILYPFYDKIEEKVQKFIDENKRLKYEFDPCNSERQVIEIFPNEATTRRQKNTSKLDASCSIESSLSFIQKSRAKIINGYTVTNGYLADKDQHVIYFNVATWEGNREVEAINKIATNISKRLCNYDIQTDDGFIELRITPDQDLTNEVIEKCFKDFVEMILNPMLTNLKN